MKAVMKTRRERGVEFKDVEEPKINEDEVLIEVKFAGVCGTDLEIYEWHPELMDTFPVPINLPFILGHEFSGEVNQMGSKVKGHRIGDRVVANPILSCGSCFFCRKGEASICDYRPTLGVGINGAFAKYVAVPATNLFNLPENVSFEEGAITELLSVAVHAAERVGVGCGDTVAITGPGPLGLMMLMVAKAAGASRVFVTGIETDEQRLKTAIELGADSVINVKMENPTECVKKLTEGLGADIVFETAGHPSAVTQAIALARKGGRVGILGLSPRLSPIQTSHIVLWEKELIGIRAYYPQTWKRSIALLSAGKVRLDPLITNKLPLADVESGFRLMGERESIKVLLKP